LETLKTQAKSILNFTRMKMAKFKRKIKEPVRAGLSNCALSKKSQDIQDKVLLPLCYIGPISVDGTCPRQQDLLYE
jgi:hypothetical protein